MQDLATSSVEYSTVTLDERGEIVARSARQAQVLTADLGTGVTLELVSLPGGTFVMGSPRGQGYDDERPQHRVTLVPFAIGRCAITQAQWQAVMGRHVCRFSGVQRPVENVSWRDATRFCEQLSKRSGRAFRLPSEAQWEYACRAGTSTPFAFGPTITTAVANYVGEHTYRLEPKGEYRHVTTEVGAFTPNAFGLCDMHGNCWEWCADAWHDSYDGAPDDGRAWVSGDLAWRVARGGCWHDPPDVCRSAARLKLKASEGDEFVGFRVALL
jgi:formylglycine-generating enzyme required for sulfatase activity